MSLMMWMLFLECIPSVLGCYVVQCGCCCTYWCFGSSCIVVVLVTDSLISYLMCVGFVVSIVYGFVSNSADCLSLLRVYSADIGNIS